MAGVGTLEATTGFDETLADLDLVARLSGCSSDELEANDWTWAVASKRASAETSPLDKSLRASDGCLRLLNETTTTRKAMTIPNTIIPWIDASQEVAEKTRSDGWSEPGGAGVGISVATRSLICWLSAVLPTESEARMNTDIPSHGVNPWGREIS